MAGRDVAAVLGMFGFAAGDEDPEHPFNKSVPSGVKPIMGEEHGRTKSVTDLVW